MSVMDGMKAKEDRPHLGKAHEIISKLRKNYCNQSAHEETFLEEKSDVSYIQQKSGKKEEGDEQKKQTFCNRILKQYLETTYKTYQSDLLILEDNLANLSEQIEWLVKKIGELPKMGELLQEIRRQNIEVKTELRGQIEKYRDSNLKLDKARREQQALLERYRKKVRMALKSQDFDTYYHEYTCEYNEYLIERRENIVGLEAKISKECNQEKNQPQTSTKELREAPEIKPKKKMSEAEKANLLGDLKSFSKNFKLH